jgi:threo-3-hydroxy-L-aspartate ammonia-lyase
MELATSPQDVLDAADRLVGIVHRTPVITSRTLDERVGVTVLCKAENLQRTGSFKFRGAYNRIIQLDEEQRRRGVISYSSGNHAQAVALAARLTGTHAVIVMPHDAPDAKRAATEGYGAEIITYQRPAEEREDVAAAIAEERGSILVPPFDDPAVIAGQGTVGLELLDDAGALDLLVVPVSGGGLIAGCALAVRARGTGTRIVGVEPAGADDTRRSLEVGERLRIETPSSIADGLIVKAPGELTFPIIQREVDEIVTVSDDEILDAVIFALDRLKLVVEPSGAVGLAALLSGRAEASGRVGIVLSGGNVGAERLGELLSSRSRRGSREDLA